MYDEAENNKEVISELEKNILELTEMIKKFDIQTVLSRSEDSNNAILSINAIPHFVDSNLNDFGVDFEKLDSYLSKNTIFKKKKMYKFKNKKTDKNFSNNTFF